MLHNVRGAIATFLQSANTTLYDSLVNKLIILIIDEKYCLLKFYIGTSQRKKRNEEKNVENGL